MDDEGFWLAFEQLISECEVVVDRLKGSKHPRYSDFIYPLDYGYLKGTSSPDGGGIDVWIGSLADKKLDAVMCIVDLIKKDSEIKLLLGCTEEEKQIVYSVHNYTEFMKGILIKRENNKIWREIIK